MIRIQLSLLVIVLSGLGIVVINNALTSETLHPTLGMLVSGVLAGIGITTLCATERFRGVVGAVFIMVGTTTGYTSYAVAQHTPGSESTGKLLVIGLVSLLFGLIVAFLPTYLFAED